MMLCRRMEVIDGVKTYSRISRLIVIGDLI